MGLRINHKITYDLSITLQTNILTIILDSKDELAERKFQIIFLNSCIPREIQPYFQNVTQIYQFLRANDSFEVNPIRGSLTFIIEKFQNSLPVEQKCEIILGAQNMKKQKQKRVEPIYNFIHPLSEGERTISQLETVCEYVNKFRVQESVIEYVGQNEEYTQFLINTVIEPEKLFKFQVSVVKGLHIIVGVTDVSKQINERKSFNSGNSVCLYGGDGCIYYGTGGENWEYQEQGIGFMEGDSLTVEVQLSKGRMQWYKDSCSLAQIFVEILKQPDRKFVPYFELYQTGDKVQYIG